MNYATIKKYDIANGEGVRVSLFVSGCPFRCKGCFNEPAWDYGYGKPFTDDTVMEICEAAAPSYISGISILGGEPMDPRNVFSVQRMVTAYKGYCYENKKPVNIWLYTGYSIESLLERPECIPILASINVLVDGLYVEALRDLTLPYRGSSNQRIIDVKQSIKRDKVVLWQPEGAYK